MNRKQRRAAAAGGRSTFRAKSGVETADETLLALRELGSFASVMAQSEVATGTPGAFTVLHLPEGVGLTYETIPEVQAQMRKADPAFGVIADALAEATPGAIHCVVVHANGAASHTTIPQHWIDPVKVDGSLDRKHVYDHNVDEIDRAYRRGRDQGVKDPVVYVVDVRDTLGRAMARAVDRKTDAQIDEMIEEFGQSHRTPTLFLAIERADAIKIETESGHDVAAEGLSSRRDEGYFPVICIAGEGAMTRFRAIPQLAVEVFDN